MSVLELFVRPGNAQLATAESMNRGGIAAHLEVPVDGALAGHCEVSALRERPLPFIRGQLVVERAMPPCAAWPASLSR
jgi:hypothetical protein